MNGSLPEQAKPPCPILSIDPGLRYPVLGADSATQRRHGASRRRCRLGLRASGVGQGRRRPRKSSVTVHPPRRFGAVSGIETTRGPIATRKIGRRSGPHQRRDGDGRCPNAAGIRFLLQALVSEPLKPIMPCVCRTPFTPMSQSDKGELVIGAGIDAYLSWSDRRSAHCQRHAGGDLRVVPGLVARPNAPKLGRIVDTTCRIVPRFSARLMCRACSSIAVGAPAASRRRRVRAICSRICSRPASPTRSRAVRRRRTGALINEATAAAVAH